MTKPVPPSPMPAEASARTWPLAAAPALYWAAIAATGDLRPGIFAVAAGAAAAWLAAGRVRTLLLLIYPTVAALPQHLEKLAARDMDYFHLYAFNLPRQLGANFEMLGSYVFWLAERGVPGLSDVMTACRRIAEGAKAVQLADLAYRSVAEKRWIDVPDLTLAG